jgi:hypothetical protein
MRRQKCPTKFPSSKKTSLIAPYSDGGLIIAIAAIMPHAAGSSKQKRDARVAIALCFPQSGMVGLEYMFARHCERSEAIQLLPRRDSGLLRFTRNDRM